MEDQFWNHLNTNGIQTRTAEIDGVTGIGSSSNLKMIIIILSNKIPRSQKVQKSHQNGV